MVRYSSRGYGPPSQVKGGGGLSESVPLSHGRGKARRGSKFQRPNWPRVAVSQRHMAGIGSGRGHLGQESGSDGAFLVLKELPPDET